MRLSSKELLARASRFLRERAVIDHDEDPIFSISWDPRRAPDFARAVDAIRPRIAGPAKYSEGRGFDGEVLPNLSWTLRSEEMADVAAWLDEACGRKPPDSVSAVCLHDVTFRWADAAVEEFPSGRLGGMFGMHFGGIRGITTRFSFATVDHYREIKRYLSEIGLVELSDKSLHSC